MRLLEFVSKGLLVLLLHETGWGGIRLLNNRYHRYLWRACHWLRWEVDCRTMGFARLKNKQRHPQATFMILKNAKILTWNKGGGEILNMLHVPKACFFRQITTEIKILFLSGSEAFTPKRLYLSTLYVMKRASRTPYVLLMGTKKMRTKKKIPYDYCKIRVLLKRIVIIRVCPRDAYLWIGLYVCACFNLRFLHMSNDWSIRQSCLSVYGYGYEDSIYTPLAA